MFILVVDGVMFSLRVRYTNENIRLDNVVDLLSNTRRLSFDVTTMHASQDFEILLLSKIRDTNKIQQNKARVKKLGKESAICILSLALRVK